MKFEISVTLNSGEVIGAVATVITKRFLRKAIHESFICIDYSFWSGGRWANEKTGLPPNERLNIALNTSAQALLDLYRVCSIKNGKR